VNLARTFGPDVVLTFAGGDPAWEQLPVYLIAPVFGGVLAAGLYALVTSTSRRTEAMSTH
jgi:glycerol uptake facilitator protein